MIHILSTSILYEVNHSLLSLCLWLIYEIITFFTIVPVPDFPETVSWTA